MDPKYQCIALEKSNRFNTFFLDLPLSPLICGCHAKCELLPTVLFGWSQESCLAKGFLVNWVLCNMEEFRSWRRFGQDWYSKDTVISSHNSRKQFDILASKSHRAIPPAEWNSALETQDWCDLEILRSGSRFQGSVQRIQRARHRAESQSLAVELGSEEWKRQFGFLSQEACYVTISGTLQQGSNKVEMEWTQVLETITETSHPMSDFFWFTF